MPQVEKGRGVARKLSEVGSNRRDWEKRAEEVWGGENKGTIVNARRGKAQGLKRVSNRKEQGGQKERL